MHDIALDLLLLLGGVWLVAVTLRPLGLPTVMGELIVGVLLGPAVLGWIQPGELIQLLAEIGIFFLMFHAGIETQPVEFYQALKRSMGVAVVGAIVPFTVSFGIALLFWSGPHRSHFRRTDHDGHCRCDYTQEPERSQIGQYPGSTGNHRKLRNRRPADAGFLWPCDWGAFGRRVRAYHRRNYAR